MEIITKPGKMIIFVNKLDFGLFFKHFKDDLIPFLEKHNFYGFERLIGILKDYNTTLEVPLYISKPYYVSNLLKTTQNAFISIKFDNFFNVMSVRFWFFYNKDRNIHNIDSSLNLDKFTTYVCMDGRPKSNYDKYTITYDTKNKKKEIKKEMF